MSTLNVDTWKNAAGSRELYPCTAWVNFNGTGTVAIRDSRNVSSVTDVAVGQYGINFANSMDTVTYCPQVTSAQNGAALSVSVVFADGTGTIITPTTASFRIATGYTDINLGDPTYCTVSIMGGLN